MDKTHQQKIIFGIGDIVEESTLLVPPGRKPWKGIVVKVEKDDYFSDIDGTFPGCSVEVYWPSQGYSEHLPSDVVKLIEKKS